MSVYLQSKAKASLTKSLVFLIYMKYFYGAVLKVDEQKMTSFYKNVTSLNGTNDVLYVLVARYCI